jgi:DNA-binding transcriptional LysR family regulator
MSTRPDSAENTTQRFLIDRLRTSRARYPAIDLGIGGSRVVSVARREGDVALRYGSMCSTTRRFATPATCARCGSSPSRSEAPDQFGGTCRTDPSPGGIAARWSSSLTVAARSRVRSHADASHAPPPARPPGGRKINATAQNRMLRPGRRAFPARPAAERDRSAA